MWVRIASITAHCRPGPTDWGQLEQSIGLGDGFVLLYKWPTAPFLILITFVAFVVNQRVPNSLIRRLKRALPNQIRPLWVKTGKHRNFYSGLRLDQFPRGFVNASHGGVIALLRFDHEQGVFINLAGASRRQDAGIYQRQYQRRNQRCRNQSGHRDGFERI